MDLDMDDFIGGASLKYKSNTILERRRRILRETRNLIAETGYHAFNVRDLCARAGIAQKTLYNAFGSKENVVAAAVQQYIIEFEESATLQFPGGTLDGFLEGCVKIHSANMRVRSYTHAIVSIFNSLGPDNVIRRAIRDFSKTHNTGFIDELARLNCLAPGVTAERLSDMLTTSAFAITADWCQGEVPDDEFLDRACELMLTVVAGSTRGKISQQAKRWLEDLREGRASWVSLRKLAEVSSSGPSNSNALRALGNDAQNPQPRAARVKRLAMAG
jgi:AcrR family transcriptional regulator